METLPSPETSVAVYQSTRRNIIEDLTLIRFVVNSSADNTYKHSTSRYGDERGDRSGTDDSHLLGCDAISLCVSRRFVQTRIMFPYISFSVDHVAVCNMMLDKRKVKQTKYKRIFSVCLLIHDVI